FFRCTHESARAPSCCVARILALPQRVLSTHISLRALARRTRFRRSIPETPGFALGSNVRHSASLIASGRSMPPHPVSCSCCIGINSGFMLILHWTILLSRFAVCCDTLARQRDEMKRQILVVAVAAL